MENKPLIQTKLFRPRITDDLVARPRLFEKLDCNRGNPLTLVAAPAGYGKSTLLSSWLERVDCPNAWISLDEHDNHTAVRDPNRRCETDDTLIIVWLPANCP